MPSQVTCYFWACAHTLSALLHLSCLRHWIAPASAGQLSVWECQSLPIACHRPNDCTAQVSGSLHHFQACWSATHWAVGSGLPRGGWMKQPESMRETGGIWSDKFLLLLFAHQLQQEFPLAVNIVVKHIGFILSHARSEVGSPELVWNLLRLSRNQRSSVFLLSHPSGMA